jgi:hypothetical protein
LGPHCRDQHVAQACDREAPQTTIPTDNEDEDYLQVPRRWDIENIFKFMVIIGPISSIFDYVTYFTRFHDALRLWGMG